jgi:putative phosphoesterase
MDAPAPDLPHKRVVRIDGASIGLIHGWGAREGLVERVRREFAGTPLDCLVFGHSHVPMCHWHAGLLLFNPGSTTDRRGMLYESVGILEIDNGMISGRIISLDESLSC